MFGGRPSFRGGRSGTSLFEEGFRPILSTAALDLREPVWDLPLGRGSDRSGGSPQRWGPVWDLRARRGSGLCRWRPSQREPAWDLQPGRGSGSVDAAALKLRGPAGDLRAQEGFWQFGFGLPSFRGGRPGTSFLWEGSWLFSVVAALDLRGPAWDLRFGRGSGIFGAGCPPFEGASLGPPF